jgi:hypothetical protein
MALPRYNLTARHWLAESRKKDARNLLIGFFEKFTEGFDTSGLKGLCEMFLMSWRMKHRTLYASYLGPSEEITPFNNVKREECAEVCHHLQSGTVAPVGRWVRHMFPLCGE